MYTFLHFAGICTSDEDCSTTWRPLPCGRRWSVRIRWEQCTTLTMYNFFGTLRRRGWRWQARGHYLRRVCHDLLSTQYLCAYHTAIVRHHTHAHWVVAVRVTHVRPQGHFAHHRRHGSHGTHAHHMITYSHTPDTSGRFHLCTYIRRVICVG